jgi:hypothetical protein
MFFERRVDVLVDVKSATWFFEWSEEAEETDGGAKEKKNKKQY